MTTTLGWGLLVLAVSATLMLCVAGDPTSAPSTTAARTVRVAVCQTLCIDSDHEGNLRRITYAVEDAARQHAQIACFPETAVLGWINPQAHELADPIPGPTSKRLADLAREHQLMIAIGLCEKEGQKLHDSAVLIGTDGRILLKHRKINTLDELFDPSYTRGTPEEIRAVETPLGRIGLLICADTFQENLINRMAAQSPDLLIVPYGWAADTSEWPAHGRRLADLVASVAKRTHCPVVGTDLVGVISAGPWRGKTYGGQSVAAGATGEILGVLRDRDVEVRVFEIPLGS
ncbi:MAG: carbon-nitrogen hydrolase family protein [Phycisphaerae bacterium]|jgi:N-carbamoylputrescine amidase